MTAARLRRRAAVVLAGATAAATVGAILPGLSPPYQYGIDKMVHLAVFALLAFIAAMACRTLRQALAAGILLGVLAVGIEFLQLAVPDRAFSKRDALASMIGVATGGPFGLWVRPRVMALAGQWMKQSRPVEERARRP